MGKTVELPPVRFELTTPGLRDQCSTTELKGLLCRGYLQNFENDEAQCCHIKR